MEHDGDDLEETDEEEEGVPVMQHVAGLPYRAAHAAFHSHLHRCAKCARMYGLDRPCYLYCPEGHDLVHGVETAIKHQRALADCN